MHRTTALLMISTLLAACGSTPPVNQAASGVSQAAPAPAQAAESRQMTTAPKAMVSELNDPASPLAKRSVFFPYDEFAIDPKFDPLLNAHAGYLKRNLDTRVTLEGNADERGSTEYNLALGQKRAEAVRKSLSLRGVSDKQMEAISYGEEKPQATCHDESCWKENRRTDIVYPKTR